jgi:nicotinamidase-related amidase
MRANISLRMGLFLALSLSQVTGTGGGDRIVIRMQKRAALGGSGAAGDTALRVVTEVQQWNPHETAIIICDMWNQHWCKGATTRVAELAPRLNQVISVARQQGMLIVHAPSDCMAYYKDFPGRKLALRYDSKKYEAIISGDNLASEKGAVWPIDQSDGGCDDVPRCQEASPWRKEIDAITIKDGDAISDNGAEIAALFDAKGIRNVILTGVHTNMCVIGRTFGLRNMVRLGKNVVLMRDMTDAMYNSRSAPYVKHLAGRDLVIDYIETYVCPTMLSTDIVGGQPFQF